MTDYTVQPFTQRYTEETPDSDNLKTGTRLETQEVTLYLGVVKGRHLVKEGVAKVDHFVAATQEGYQRPCGQTRIDSIRRYITSKGGLLPTALLVNVRDGAHFTANGSNYGVLHVPDDQPLWVMDGQHRFEGLKAALRYDGDLNYEIPVVFIAGFSVEAEQRVFYDVNHSAKSVSTDIVSELRVREAERLLKEGVFPSETKKREISASKIAHALNTDPASVWYQRIADADAPPKIIKERPIRISKFQGSFRTFLSDRWAMRTIQTAPDDYEPLIRIVKTYWQALGELMPEALGNPQEYAIQRPVGVYVFNEVLPTILHIAERNRDYSQQVLVRELEKAEGWVQAITWKTGPDASEPLVNTNSRYAVSRIRDEILAYYDDTLADFKRVV